MPQGFRIAMLAAATLAAALAGPAQAQGHAAYKWVDAAGRVHYGDRPPPVGAIALTGSSGSSTAATAAMSLPATLARIAQAFPVVLYTTDDCKPCALGRELLAARGVPYAEKRVVGPADVDAFKRLGFAEVGFPALSVGQVRETGFDSQGWVRLLDAAGYPAESALPPQWRPPAATALVPAPVRPGALETAATDDPSRLLDARTMVGTPGTRPVVRTNDAGFRF